MKIILFSKKLVGIKFSIRRSYLSICLFLLILCSFALSACIQNKPGNSSDSATNNPPINDVKETLTLIPTSMLTVGDTDQPMITATRTIDPQYYLGHKIAYTQVPVIVSTNAPIAEDFLYKDVIVTIIFTGEGIARAYFNLDDLEDNGEMTSDVEVVRNLGNDFTYSIYAVNNSYFYHLQQTAMDFDTCRAYFPITGMSQLEYLLQSELLPNESTYCFLTNENRIAVVNYVMGSLHWNDEGTDQLMSFRITVYKKIIDDL